MSKLFKIIIILCILIFVLSISGSLIYYYGFFKPANQKAEWEAELEWEKEKEIERRKIEILREIEEDKDKNLEEFKESLNRKYLAKCLDDAYENYIINLDNAYEAYIENWNAECKRLGLKPDSALPDDIAERLGEHYDRDVERMDKLYEDEKKECFKFFGSD